MKKRILAFLCLITLFVSSITVNAEEIEVGSNESVMASSSETYAYSIGGVNSAGDDFTPNVDYSSTIFGLMGSVSHAYKNTTPTYSYLSGNNPGNYKRLGSKIVLLTGHANGSLIELDNGSTKVGVHTGDSYTANSGGKYVGLNSISMSNTDLIMFFGCSTATGDTNLCTESVSRGAKSAVGTTQSVVSRSGEGATWVQRFIDGLYNGKNIIQAGAYANNFVSSTCSMRTGWTYKGSGYTVVNPKANARMSEVQDIDARFALDASIVDEDVQIQYGIFNDNVIAANALDFEEGLEEVVSYLRGIDDSFDLSNYKISMRSFNDNEGIVTLDYYIGDNISTTKGFTFIYCDGMLVSLTYNSQLYSNGRSTYQTVDEDNMIALVNSYEADRSSTMNTSIVEDENTISYYTYDYKTGELKYVSEVYTFDGEAWNGNATEVILN